jgi:hypothetical protein
MKNKRLKFSIAAFGLVIAMISTTAITIAQTTPLCRWDKVAELCKPIAEDGYCAIGGPECDVPVVE